MTSEFPLNSGFKDGYRNLGRQRLCYQGQPQREKNYKDAVYVCTDHMDMMDGNRGSH